MDKTMSEAQDRPELFFGLAAPVGVNLEVVMQTLAGLLQNHGYKALPVHLTDILPAIDETHPTKFESLFDQYDARIKSANELRRKFGNDIMAAAGLFQIRAKRKAITGSSDKPAPGTAYLIRQLKRPEEIALLRRIYGKQVFQISVYSDEEVRKLFLAQKMQSFHATATRISEFEAKALELIRRDEFEDLKSGQQLREVFPLADVFVDATTVEVSKATLDRFLQLVFGHNFTSPTRDEYGMYIAKSASFRSVDLSRQVGAAVFSCDGEVKVMGCNE